MTLDTQACRQLAATLAAMRQSMSFTSPILQSRHSQICTQIAQLETFFLKLASWGEQAENGMITSIAMPSAPGWHGSVSTSGSLASLSRGRSVSLSGTGGYTLGNASVSWSSGPAYAGASISALEISLQGTAAFTACSGRRFSPRLELSASGSARAAGASVEGRVGNDLASLSARAIGEAGAVYASAQCVLSLDEQTLSARCGAAALRGECEAAFELAGVTLTIAASGSVGSLEAGFGYENKPGEWTVDVNAALFAGAGVRIKVEY